MERPKHKTGAPDRVIFFGGVKVVRRLFSKKKDHGMWMFSRTPPGGSAMVKLEFIVSGKELKRLLGQDRDLLRDLVREVVQQTLEAEMEAP